DSREARASGWTRDEPADLAELGHQVVLPLEVARLRAEQVDDGEEDAEPGQDEGADPDLERAQARLRHGDLGRPQLAREELADVGIGRAMDLGGAAHV